MDALQNNIKLSIIFAKEMKNLLKNYGIYTEYYHKNVGFFLLLNIINFFKDIHIFLLRKKAV